MYLVAVAAVGLDADLVPTLSQQVRHMVQPLAVVAAGVAVAGNEIHRQRGGHHLRPLAALNEAVQLHQIPHQLQRDIEAIEHVARVVGDDIGVAGDPVRRAVGVFDPRGHIEEDLAEPVADRLIRVGGDGGLYRRVVQLDLAALELRYNAAEHEPLEVVAVERGIGAAEH